MILYSSDLGNGVSHRLNIAGVAQSVEQLIRNQQVAGSNPVTSSKKYRYPFGWRFFAGVSGENLVRPSCDGQA